MPDHLTLRLDIIRTQGVADLRVGLVGLPVNAVRVDLRQDRYAGPGAAG